ncbi:unnamed protein product [Caretta caretta]
MVITSGTLTWWFCHLDLDCSCSEPANGACCHSVTISSPIDQVTDLRDGKTHSDSNSDTKNAGGHWSERTHNPYCLLFVRNSIPSPMYPHGPSQQEAFP